VANLKVTSGTIPFRGFETWYERVGEGSGGKTPLLTLHGGPGALHNYLKSLDGIAADEAREVIYYDQLGCGKSSTPYLPELWNIETYVAEIDAVREALGLDEIHILGQSWGGMLALEYVLRTAHKGVRSLVIASSLASIPLWAAEARRLIQLMEPGHRDAIEAAIAADEYAAPEFKEAAEEYVRRYECSLDPLPSFVAESFDNISPVYSHMWGPEEFVCTGTLQNWDITERLGEIDVPTLVTTGVQDEATPYIAKSISDGIVGARLELVPGTHLCHVEHSDEYNALVENFLALNDPKN
jgi:proline-specific peptidase